MIDNHFILLAKRIASSIKILTRMIDITSLGVSAIIRACDRKAVVFIMVERRIFVGVHSCQKGEFFTDRISIT
jgi:hypothetical protein